MKFTKLTIEDIICELPDISKLDFSTVFNNKSYDYYIQALGFEQRTYAVSEKLSRVTNFYVEDAIILYYKTNIEDNFYFQEKVLTNLKSFSKRILSIDVDENCVNDLKQRILSKDKKSDKIRIILDFSTLSSQLILSLVKLFLDIDIDLIIVYTEGLIYHPTIEEFNILITDSNEKKTLQQTFGVEKISICPDYSGGEKENQDLIICFPSFVAERTEAVISFIDDLVIKNNEKNRLIWIIGDPNMDDYSRSKRKEIQKYIHKLDNNVKIYEVCTLDYKKTLNTLEHVFNDTFNNYHINISDLGSKMQSLGIAVFANLRRNVSVYYSEPVKYNSLQYSEKVKDYWFINIGKTKDFVNTLFKVGLIIEELT